MSSSWEQKQHYIYPSELRCATWGAKPDWKQAHELFDSPQTVHASSRSPRASSLCLSPLCVSRILIHVRDRHEKKKSCPMNGCGMKAVLHKLTEAGSNELTQVYRSCRALTAEPVDRCYWQLLVCDTSTRTKTVPNGKTPRWWSWI